MKMIRAVGGAAVAATALAAIGGTAAAAPAAKVDRVTLSIKSDTEHAKKGPDGKWHDAYLPAAFSAEVGDAVVVTVRNYDSSPHTFTSTKLGLNVVIEKGSAAHPSTTTFTFHPAKAGTFSWQCIAGCDPWAMTHLGYMKGRITVGARGAR